MRLRPHALNDGFVWSPRRGPFRRISAEQARAFDEQGFFVLENAFSPEEMAEIAAEIDPIEARVESFLRAQGGRFDIARADEITFSIHLVRHSERLHRFVSGPVFRDLGHDLVGPDVRLYWDQAVYKKPGTEAPFPWHQDNGYTYVEPQAYLTCWVALTDATPENGCPVVVPGLHRGGTLHHEKTDLGQVCFDVPPCPAVMVPARAGSVVVFSSLTPHATGPNRTQRVRRAYIVQLAPDGAAQVRLAPDGARERIPCDDPERQFRI